MKNFALGLLIVIPITLFARVIYLLLMAPAPDAAAIDHSYRMAAYALVWAIQLGYVARLAVKWQAQKRAAKLAGLDSVNASNH